jgi:hypothetical protein
MWAFEASAQAAERLSAQGAVAEETNLKSNVLSFAKPFCANRK